jgi:glutaminyl-peptide cyclotransferase
MKHGNLSLAEIRSCMIPGMLLFFLVCCHSGSRENRTTDTDLTNLNKKEFELATPALDQSFMLGDPLVFLFKSYNQSAEIDSVAVFLEGRKIRVESPKGMSFTENDLFHKVGHQNIRLIIYFGHNQNQTLSTRVTILSDTDPSILQYKVIRQFVHDTLSYTQGLLYFKGFIYEGTGQQGRSKLRKIDPATGAVLKERKLDDNFFGEGITILNNEIYQLTYLSKVGFVYNLETFEFIRQFNLQTNEGWGITTDGRNLLLSDGSSTIYYYDPEYFTQTDQLNVSNRLGLVSKLNELEFAKNYVWANIYGQSFIIKIDPKTGKVLAQADLIKIYPKGIPDSYDYVLNGIAYNPDSDTFFITGKLWPVIYEIKIAD